MKTHRKIQRVENNQESYTTRLSKNMRILRYKNGMSLNKLSEKSGISYPIISAIEMGKRKPGQSVLKIIAKAFDVSVDELLK